LDVKTNFPGHKSGQSFSLINPAPVAHPPFKECRRRALPSCLRVTASSKLQGMESFSLGRTFIDFIMRPWLDVPISHPQP